MSAVVMPTANATSTPAAAIPAPAAAYATVTLITGDTVTLGPDRGGRPAVSLKPVGGATTVGSYTTLHKDGDVYVVPSKAADLVPEVLDLELFNVTDLAEMGYDDASTDALPVIVQGPRPLAALGAQAKSRPLPSIDAMAVSLPKRAAASFATTLSAPAGASAAGVTKVWLDQKVKATEYDENLVQIGAPQVWESGLSGEGVDVAVLDSGVDTEHPDLRGKVASEANFTTDGSPADGHGHGTHVASIIAGSGAASDGARKGVAFGARLLSGKVLAPDEFGGATGQASWLIAGMEWAAKQGADVVNISAGGLPSEGDDPLAQAVDALSAGTGTLFVVAAGNYGNFSHSISTPGVAESALTVGATRPDGIRWHYSGRGPTRGTWRAKPDLLAPGVDIIGAHAGGGAADSYTTMTGTSQATPHVAGAAALLKQQHPDWDWQRIKTTLMTTADAYDDLYPYSTGTGRLDLPDATTETLQLNRGNVDFGFLRYPNGKEPRTIELTLTNTGTDPRTVTLTDHVLDANRDPAPESLLTVSLSEVTIAPGGTERVTVTLTPGNAAPGHYFGAVVLTGEGLKRIALPTSFFIEPPRHDLRLTVLDRRGEPWAGGALWVVNGDNFYPGTGGGVALVHLDENGQGTARMSPGPVSLMATVVTPAADGTPATVSMAGSPEVMLDSDMSYTIDAREAHRLDPATVEGVRTTASALSFFFARRAAKGEYTLGDGFYASSEEIRDGRVFVQPTNPVQHGKAVFESYWQLDAINPSGTDADVYHLLLGGGSIPDPPIYRVSRAQARDLARLESDYRSLPGQATHLVTWTPQTDSVSHFAVERLMDGPQRRVEMVTADPAVRWRQCVLEVPMSYLCAPAATYQSGERLSPVWYQAPAPMAFGSHSRNGISLPIPLSDGQHRGAADPTAAGNKSLRLWRDGVEVAPFEPGSAYFDIPAERAMFRLEHASSPDPDLLPIGRETMTAWTFPSEAPTDPDQFSAEARPLNVDYQPGTDGHGFLPAGMPLVLGARLFTSDSNNDELRYERGSLRFWASTDHGGRWHQATVTNTDGSFHVVVPGLIPRAGDMVSVRAEGKAAGDRTVEQTIIDAYPVR
ncbi:S8 family serine peptidase [Micromonospora sp. NPDC050495]|uniref:S8 family peptidase n=1 Tax=Micromonospora sp. NPDC050495 TaxID=3154936 RepID=UPI0033D73EF7